MTIRYVDGSGAITTDVTVTKVEPIQNGVNYLITATTDYIISIRNLIEIT